MVVGLPPDENLMEYVTANRPRPAPWKACGRVDLFVGREKSDRWIGQRRIHSLLQQWQYWFRPAIVVSVVFLEEASMGWD